MRVRGKSKTKSSKFNARVGFVVCLGMLLAVVPQLEFTKASFGGKIFSAIWVFSIVAGLYQTYRNGFTEDGIEHEVTEHDLEIDGGERKHQSSVDFAKKMRAIENLKKEGLISAAEFERKRKDVLDEDWGK